MTVRFRDGRLIPTHFAYDSTLCRADGPVILWDNNPIEEELYAKMVFTNHQGHLFIPKDFDPATGAASYVTLPESRSSSTPKSNCQNGSGSRSGWLLQRATGDDLGLEYPIATPLQVVPN